MDTPLALSRGHIPAPAAGLGAALPPLGTQPPLGSTAHPLGAAAQAALSRGKSPGKA